MFNLSSEGDSRGVIEGIGEAGGSGTTTSSFSISDKSLIFESMTGFSFFF